MRRCAVDESRGAPVVRAREVHRVFRGAAGNEIRVLRGVDLDVATGQTVAITGPSGAGKSTLLHLLGALDKPTRGTVAFDGRVLDGLDDAGLARLRNRHVGFVFQFHHLLRDFSAIENVMIPQIITGVPRGSARERAGRLLAQVGLEHRMDHRPGKLSGGEQQRVAVARALANEPPLLLADEPAGNLDTDTSARLTEVLFRLVRDHGTALVLVTHNRELAACTDRILHLRNGVLEPADPMGTDGDGDRG
ncbi:MAG: ABC transporter ATP-binding protein [Gemmatimonadota bacterium]